MGLSTKKNRLEAGEGTAAALLAGTVWAYTAKPKTLLLLPQKSKAEVESISRQVWRQTEDDAMLMIQHVFLDPHFLLTAFAVNNLPDTVQGQARSVRRVRERFEKLGKRAQSADAVDGRLAQQVSALAALRDRAGVCVRGAMHTQGTLTFWERVASVLRGEDMSTATGLPVPAQGAPGGAADERLGAAAGTVPIHKAVAPPSEQASVRGLAIVSAASAAVQQKTVHTAKQLQAQQVSPPPGMSAFGPKTELIPTGASHQLHKENGYLCPIDVIQWLKQIGTAGVPAAPAVMRNAN